MIKKEYKISVVRLQSYNASYYLKSLIQNNTLRDYTQAIRGSFLYKCCFFHSFDYLLCSCYNCVERKDENFMDQVMLEVDLHLVNNIRVIYYLVSNSVEKRVLINKINGILAKKDVHHFSNGEDSYYSIPVEKVLYTTVNVRKDLDTKTVHDPIFTTY